MFAGYVLKLSPSFSINHVVIGKVSKIPSGVGAALEVSPNWTQETMTCHSSIVLVLFGVKVRHRW